jgi:hypothetical protein
MHSNKSIIILFYNLLINTRDVNKRTNLGKTYFEKTYIITTRNMNANVTSFIK